MNKFLKIIWSINGVLLLMVLVFFGVFMLIEFIKSFDSYNEPEIIVGEKLVEAKKEGLILQGLELSSLTQVKGLKGFILPVHIRTYETPKHVNPLNFESRSKLRIGSYYTTVNILFLDEQLNVTRKLLDRKGFIESFKYPMINEPGRHLADTSIQNMTYLIAFDDSNKDGAINEDDLKDLYISNIDGSALTRITTDVDVLDYQFINRDEILIRFNKREALPDEHKKEYFARFEVDLNKLTELTNIRSTVDEIETLLLQ